MYPLVIGDILHTCKESQSSIRATASHSFNNRDEESQWAETSHCYQIGMESTDALRHAMVKEEFFEFPSDPATTASASANDSTAKKMAGYYESESANTDQSRQEDVAKETNNNHLMMNSVDIVNYVDSNFWPCSDSTILEELNCWSGGGQSKGQDNTDGTIYTLTVLNGGGGSGNEHPTWFKADETNKEDRLPQSSLDLESLLNIIPNNFPTSYQAEQVKQDIFDGGASTTSFQTVKEEQMEILGIPQQQPQQPQHEYVNNNEWKENNNEVDSLLRNALQGKSFSRYNGIKTEPKEEKKEDIHMEAAPPPPPSILYDGGAVLHDSDNPSSAQSMDDIFLSQLDVSYPEDYEKLKRIETEVAESVEQYCLDRTYVPSVQMSLDPILIQNKSTKKYTKRSKNGGASGSSGVRKERSLHYCNICNKGFKDKYSVNVHIRTHTGEKPFTCSLCGKSFRQKAHLAKHYQTHMAQAKTGIAHKAPKNLIPTTT